MSRHEQNTKIMNLVQYEIAACDELLDEIANEDVDEIPNTMLVGSQSSLMFIEDSSLLDDHL